MTPWGYSKSATVIPDGAVTTAKLAPGAVTATKVADSVRGSVVGGYASENFNGLLYRFPFGDATGLAKDWRVPRAGSIRELRLEVLSSALIVAETCKFGITINGAFLGNTVTFDATDGAGPFQKSVTVDGAVAATQSLQVALEEQGVWAGARAIECAWAFVYEVD